MNRDIAKKLLKKVKEVMIYTKYYSIPLDELAKRLEVYVDTTGKLDLKDFTTAYNGYSRFRKHNKIVFYKWDFQSRVNHSSGGYNVEFDFNKYYVELTHPYGAYIFCEGENEYRDLQDMRREYINEIKENYKPIAVKAFGDNMLFNREDGLKLAKDYDEILKKYNAKAKEILAETKIQRLERQLAEEKAKAGIK